MGDQLKIRGINHLTVAVTDLERSIDFYCNVLGCDLRARWGDGAYLEAGTLWLCLSVDLKGLRARGDDYTHVAFDVAPEEFEALSARVRTNAEIWKENRSEGASLYFLDPDGHRLELHVGSLASRLAFYRDSAEANVTILIGKSHLPP